MNWKIIVALIATGGIGYAAYRYFKKQATLLQDYEIKPIGAKIIKFSKELSTIEFTLRILNKSNIEATVQQLYADVYVNDYLAGYVNNTQNVAIPANGTSDIKIMFTFSPVQILKNILTTLNALLQQKDISYRLKGYVKIKSSFIGVSVPFDYNGSLKQDLLSTVSVKS